LFIEGNLPTLQRMKSLRYGIIGTGTMGREHLRCVEIVDGAEVVAVADSIRNELSPTPDIEAGWWGTVVGLAAEQAVRESRIVEINDFTDP
jgi:predicted homoserine dehydrogenase-like protein